MRGRRLWYEFHATHPTATTAPCCLVLLGPSPSPQARSSTSFTSAPRPITAPSLPTRVWDCARHRDLRQVLFPRGPAAPRSLVSTLSIDGRAVHESTTATSASQVCPRTSSSRDHLAHLATLVSRTLPVLPPRQPSAHASACHFRKKTGSQRLGTPPNPSGTKKLVEPSRPVTMEPGSSLTPGDASPNYELLAPIGECQTGWMPGRPFIAVEPRPPRARSRSCRWPSLAVRLCKRHCVALQRR